MTRGEAERRMSQLYARNKDIYINMGREPNGQPANATREYVDGAEYILHVYRTGSRDLLYTIIN